jgi:hypothetical protein
MGCCFGGIVPKLQHNKPLLPNIWLVNPTTNNIQSEADALGQIRFVHVQGAPLMTLITKFNELQILLRAAPSVQNGCKLCVEQCLPMNMFRMKDTTILDAKVVNITFTPQGHTYIYELSIHESTITNLPCTYFVTIGVSSQVLVQILFPIQHVLNIATTLLASTFITSIMCIWIW